MSDPIALRQAFEDLAASQRMLWSAQVERGFTQEQALYLVGIWTAAALGKCALFAKPEPPQPT